MKRFVVLACAIACCAATPLRPSILNGSASGSSDDATILLVEIDPATNQRVGLCTAALVADRLVLTARHCVARTNGDAVACSSDGTPVFGGEIRSNVDAKNLYVFTGASRPAGIGDTGTVDPSTWKPASRGEAILDDGSTNLCDHDLAFVLLDKPITGIDHARIRVDRGVAVGETLRTVGWGVTSGEIEPRTRQQRGGVRVTRIGPDDASPVLTPSEVLFGESICLGDSGGPVFAEGSGAIIGVVSRGGNGVDPTSGGPSVSCVEAKNVATRLSPFRDFVLSAYGRANASPKTEPEEDEGCSTSHHHGSGAWLVLLGLLIARRCKR